jgi:hypothetical protein
MDLNSLPQQDVQRHLLTLQQILHDVDPELNVSHGPVHDRLLYYAAAFATVNELEIAEAFAKLDVSRVLCEPDSAPSADVDELAGRWGVRRRPAKLARGQISLVVPKPNTLIVPAGTRFVAGRIVFRTEQTYSLRATSGKLTAKTDRLLVQQSDGWCAVLDVVAEHPGRSGNIQIGTRLTTPLPISYVRLTAETDFYGGADPETNRELATRLLSGYTGRVASNAWNVEAMLRQVPGLETAHFSILRADAPENPTPEPVVYCKDPAGRISIATCQAAEEALNDPQFGNLGGHVSVREAHLFTLTARLTAYRHAGQTVDPQLVGRQLAHLVNRDGFVGRVSAQSLLSSPAMSRFGLVYDMLELRPNSECPTADPRQVVEVCERPEHGITARTTAFYLDPADVLVNLVAAGS